MGLTGSAHLISGNTETISDILAFLEQQGIATVANPDLYVRTYSHFGIDEARALPPGTTAATSAASLRSSRRLNAPSQNTPKV